jgi:hypothetical protein
MTKALMRAKSRTSLERPGIYVSRYGLVITLLLHRQHRGHHHLRTHGEFSLFNTGSFPVLTRISPVRGFRPILNQGSRSFRCIDLDCCRNRQDRLDHSQFLILDIR